MMSLISLMLRRVDRPISPLGLKCATGVNGIRFIRLNTQEAKPAGISPWQIEWFKAELRAAQARGERIVIFQHNYPYQIWEDFAGPGTDDWRGLVQTHRVEAIVCGHTHYWQLANDGRNVLMAVRSIGDPEGGRRVRDRVFPWRRSGDHLSIGRRPRTGCSGHAPTRTAAGDEPPSHRERARPRGRTDLVASPLLDVRYRIDDGPWADLESRNDGHWQSWLPSDGFARGEHSLKSSRKGMTGPRARSRSISWSIKRADTPRCHRSPDGGIDPVLLTRVECQAGGSTRDDVLTKSRSSRARIAIQGRRGYVRSGSVATSAAASEPPHRRGTR